MEVSLSKILTNLDQTVLLLDQVFDNILYTRRFTALKQIAGDPMKTKQLLKEKLDIFAKETQFLFGGRFESDTIRTTKIKQKSKEVFLTITNKQHLSRGPLSRRDPLLENQPNKGREQYFNMVISKNHS